MKVYSINTDGYISLEYNHYNVETVYIEDCHLYLRPMSSMTEEEKFEFNSYYNMFNNNPVGLIDWLNKKMFAYRIIDGKDMFELGLALEASKDMYNIKEK